MLKSGDQVRCLDAINSNRTLELGAVYTVDVGQVDDGAMISVIGIEGSFLASRFELADRSETVDSIFNKRELLIAKCVDECMSRVAAAAMCAIKKLHIIMDGAKRFTTTSEIIERSEHLCERLVGVELATDWTLAMLDVDAICERVTRGSSFDIEQIEHDVKVKLKQIFREL